MGGGGGWGACAEAKIWSEFFSEKRNSIRHFARFNFSRLLLAFISMYYPILHVVKSKNSVKLGEYSASDFYRSDRLQETFFLFTRYIYKLEILLVNVSVTSYAVIKS